jgi:hypothetical protein
VKHSSWIVFHFSFFEIEIFGLVVSDANLHPLAVRLLGGCLVGRPNNKIIIVRVEFSFKMLILAANIFLLVFSSTWCWPNCGLKHIVQTNLKKLLHWWISQFLGAVANMMFFVLKIHKINNREI